MAGLVYVGPDPLLGPDLVTRRALTDQLDTAPPNHTSVASQAVDYAATLADQVYVDNRDNLYVLPAYYQSRDLLNIPLTARGVASGVAGLDSAGKVPVPQLPVLGAGYLVGTFGPRHLDNSSSVFSGSTGSTPMKICDWELGAQSVTTFRPLVFMTVMVSSTPAAQPVIEVRISNGPAAYASQNLVARGSGRVYFNDKQAIAVIPCPAVPSMSGLTTPPTYANPFLTAWLFDPQSQSVTVAGDGIISAATFLLRSAE